MLGAVEVAAEHDGRQFLRRKEANATLRSERGISQRWKPQHDAGGKPAHEDRAQRRELARHGHMGLPCSKVLSFAAWGGNEDEYFVSNESERQCWCKELIVMSVTVKPVCLCHDPVWTGGARGARRAFFWNCLLCVCAEESQGKA